MTAAAVTTHDDPDRNPSEHEYTTVDVECVDKVVVFEQTAPLSEYPDGHTSVADAVRVFTHDEPVSVNPDGHE